MNLLKKLFSGVRKESFSKNPTKDSYIDETITIRLKDNYWEPLDNIKDWQSKKNYTKMLSCCEKSLPLLHCLVKDTKREYGSFDISSIPAIEVGCRYWAALGKRNKLLIVKDIVSKIPELNEGWGAFVESSFSDADLSEKIQEYIRENPGFPQNKMGKALNVSGRDTSRLLKTLENLNKIRRIKSGKTYKLFINE